MAEEDERFERRFTADEQHGHRAEHEAAEEGEEKGEVAEEFCAEVFRRAHRGGSRDDSAARDEIAANRVGNEVVAEKANEHHA